MRNYLTILFIFFLGANLLLVGCKGKNQDAKDIEEVLTSSLYSDEDQSRALDDNDTVPEIGLMSLSIPDTMKIPWVKFVRKITEFRRHVTVEVNDTIATANIGTGAEGYFIVINDTLNPVRYRRALADTGIRTVYLTKKDGRWRIRKITPKNIWTKDAAIPITITKLKAEAQPSGNTFEITNPDTFLTKDQLPTFQPDDTVKVTVTIQMQDDSAWVFLHRGRKRPYRRRQPLVRINTYEFQRQWVIRTDTDVDYDGPVVRPSAIDAIQWQTLWGDSAAAYNCRAWALPYVVKRSNESYPDSE